jgi:hypothetical protein
MDREAVIHKYAAREACLLLFSQLLVLEYPHPLRHQFFSQTLPSQWTRSEACSAEATRAVPSSSKARLEGKKTTVIRVRNSSPLHLNLNLTFQCKSSQANHFTLQDSMPSRRSSAEERSTPSKHVESTRRSLMVPERCSRRRLGE